MKPYTRTFGDRRGGFGSYKRPAHGFMGLGSVF